MTEKIDPLFQANHLTAVRWVLAGLVAVGHLWLLTTAYEPIRVHHWTGGYMAVNGFFVLSGMLIAKSLAMRGDLKAYAASRALRIYPALIVLMLAFIFIFGTFFSVPGGLSQIGSSENWLYALRVLLLGDPEHAPGGIFAGNLEEDFNGPLWTIRYEIVAYILAALGFTCKLLSGFWRTIAVFLIVQMAYLGLPVFVDFAALPAGLLPLLRLSSAFLMGMVLWHWPAARRPHWGLVIALIAAFLIFGARFGGELLGNLALAGVMLRLGLSQKTYAPLLKLPDYSYGLYIWHYPVMQIVMFLRPDTGPLMLGVLSIPVFISLSAASWHWVEKPALKLKPGRQPKATTSILEEAS